MSFQFQSIASENRPFRDLASVTPSRPSSSRLILGDTLNGLIELMERLAADYLNNLEMTRCDCFKEDAPAF